MHARRGTVLTLAALCALAALALGACSHPVSPLRANARPRVTLTSAPIDTSELDPAPGHRREYFYAYKLQWSGWDPDGSVRRFVYAVDPPGSARAAAGAETTWVATTKNEEIVFFRATERDPWGSPTNPTSSLLHVFVIKAVDNQGLHSEPVARAFFSYTVAPSVRITSPQPSQFLQPSVPPSLYVTWEGADPDGQFTQKPVKYKYRLYSSSREDLDAIRAAMTDVDVFRDSVVAGGFAGYDSTSADTTFAFFDHLTPTATSGATPYLFVVVAFDEAGAYSPLFSFNSNMLLFTVGYANATAPRFHVWNAFVDYEYTSGGYSRPTSPTERKVIQVQVPADVPLDFNWEATSATGIRINGYRWVLGRNEALVDLDDETERTDEETDWYHWSHWSPLTKSCHIGALAPGHRWLYIEAIDQNRTLGNAVLYLTIVRPTLNRDLLVVDDTRREVDMLSGGARDTVIDDYRQDWPSSSELDTLLYARGGTRWRGLPPGTDATTPAGFLAGYTFDTLGTRQGYDDLSRTVTLTTLAPYRHVLWLVDADAATRTSLDPQRSMPALRFFSRVYNGVGAANPLMSYLEAGGQAWLAGGGIGMASTQRWLSRAGVGDIPGIGQSFSSAPDRELAPGRFMVDAAGWSNEFVAGRALTNVRRFAGPYRSDLRVTPASLPPDLSVITAANTPLPPQRETNPGSFYPPGDMLQLEYISDRTADLEPGTGGERSTLDTLLVIEGGFIRTGYPDDPEWVSPVMTWYHPSRRGTTPGSTEGSVVMTGFAPWMITRPGAVSLVDFVLQGLWNLPHQYVDRTPGMLARARPNGASRATPLGQRVLPIRRQR